MGLTAALSGVGPAVSLALACYGVLGAFYPFLLVVYHFYLVTSGQNTHEYVFPPSMGALANGSCGTSRCIRGSGRNRSTRVMGLKISSRCYAGRNQLRMNPLRDNVDGKVCSTESLFCGRGSSVRQVTCGWKRTMGR